MGHVLIRDLGHYLTMRQLELSLPLTDNAAIITSVPGAQRTSTQLSVFHFFPSLVRR